MNAVLGQVFPGPVIVPGRTGVQKKVFAVLILVEITTLFIGIYVSRNLAENEIISKRFQVDVGFITENRRIE